MRALEDPDSSGLLQKVIRAVAEEIEVLQRARKLLDEAVSCLEVVGSFVPDISKLSKVAWVIAQYKIIKADEEANENP